MQISTRKDAIAAKIGQYFTGKPCRKGHLSNRYTKSGACAACVALAASAVRGLEHSGIVVPRAEREAAHVEKMQTLIAGRQAKADAIKALNPIRVPIYSSEDIATVFDTAVELCLAAHPVLERADVLPSRAPLKGTPLYRVHVPPDQEELLRGIADALYARHVDVSHFAERVAAQVEKMANDAASEPPRGWK